MRPDDLLTAIERESALALDAAHGHLTLAVPSCPGWTVEDLLFHFGEVQRFWAHIAGTLATDPSSYVEPARPDTGDVEAWFRDGAALLLGTLRAADPAATVWTWAPQHDVAFVVRRMAQEAAVHRVDAQLASGRVDPIDHQLAIDGIDEFLTFMAGHGGAGTETVGGSVHLHATDGPGEWLVTPAGDGFEVAEGHQKGDAAIRGGASDLLLALWHRVSLESLDVVGDAGVAQRFLDATKID